MKHSTVGWWAALVGILGLLSPTSADTAWKTFTDASGVSIRYPVGWTAERQGYTMVVQSADRASMVIISMFQHAAGETAQAHLQTAAAQGSTWLPQPHITHLQQQPCNNGDEAVAQFSFPAANGHAGRGLAVCLVQPQSATGFLFVAAAPTDRLATDRPVLAKVLESFGLERGATAADSAPQYVAWTDPAEHAFSTQVPAGWKVSGGTYRFGLMDPRTMMFLQSPDGQIGIMRGDASVTTFQKPNGITMQTGMREGATVSPGPGFTGVLLHYLPAQEFNQLYVTDRLSKSLDNVSIVGQEDRPELASQLAAQAQAQFPLNNIRFSATAARATFTATSRETGKPLAGVLLSWTKDAGGVWMGNPTVCLYPADGSAEANQRRAEDVAQHVLLGYTVDPAWQDKQLRLAMELSREQSQAVWQMMQQQAADFAARSKASFEATMDYIHNVGVRTNAQFEANDAARTATTERWVDFALDREKLVNPGTGEISTQPMSMYHYQSGGAVINTDSRLLSPGPDWTPLQSAW